MKKSALMDVLKLWVSSSTVFLMVLFLFSCSHQSDLLDDAELFDDEAVAEVSTDGGMDAEELTEEEEMAEAEEAIESEDTAEFLEDTEATQAEAEDTSEFEEELTSVTETSTDALESYDTATVTTPDTMTDSLTSDLDSFTTVEPTAQETTTQKPEPKRILSSTPTIPEQAVSRNGQSLNRYYFVRQGDTADSISSRIYGNQAKADDLVNWNGSNWKLGHTLYYVSPNNAADTQMQSFYQDMGQVGDDYTVKTGDWLSTIATNQYGNMEMWKEIAVINQIQNPDHIVAGQTLTVYSHKTENKMAKAPVVNTQEPDVTLPAEYSKPLLPQQEFALNNQDQLKDPLNEMEPLKVKQETKEEANVGLVGFIQQYFFALLAAVVFGLIALGFYFFRVKEGERF